MPFQFSVQQQCDPTVLAQMHAAALTIIAQTGFTVDHAEIRSELLRREGFAEKNGRLCIAPERVESWLSASRARQAQDTTQTSTKPPRACWVDNRAFWMVDRDGVTVRAMTRSDVIAGAKLIEVLRDQGVHGNTPGFPTDVPSALQPIEQYLLSAEYSSQGGDTAQITDIPTAEIIRDMNRVYARPLDLSVWLPSPLIFAGNELEILWHFRRDLHGIVVGSMPIMGVTGPCDLLGVFTLAIAETIGGAAMLHALFPDLPIGIAPHPEPAYLGNGGIVFGTPEWQLLDGMHRSVYEYYGMPRTGKLCHTIAAVPNAQTQIESTVSILLGALAGYTSIGPLGLLSNDEVWSPAQLLLDLDIVDYAQRLVEGAMTPHGYTLASLPALVDSVMQQGVLFVEDESTVQNMRWQYQQPRYLQRLSYAQWQVAGRPDAVQQAQQHIDALIDQYQYQPPREVIRDLRAIYERGCTRLGIAGTREWRIE